MTWVIYGTDTGSIEDARQCVLVKVPDQECDSFESLEKYLEAYGEFGLNIGEFIDALSGLPIK